MKTIDIASVFPARKIPAIPVLLQAIAKNTADQVSTLQLVIKKSGTVGIMKWFFPLLLTHGEDTVRMKIY